MSTQQLPEDSEPVSASPQRPLRGMPIGVGALALLVAGLGSWVPGLWHDEVATLVAAERSWTSLGRMLTGVDAIHGVYYVIMHLWVDVAGDSALALRMPSVLAVGGTAALLAAFAQRQWGSVAGIVAGLASVAIPRSLWMGTEARSYALATFLTALMVFTFWRALHERGRAWWAMYAATGALAIGFFIYSVLVMPALLLAARQGHGWEGRRRACFATTGIAIMLASPVILLAVLQREQIAFLTPITFTDVLQAPAKAFLGGSGVANAAAWVVLLTVSGVVWLLFARRAATGERALITLVAGWLIIPPLVLLGVSLVIPLWLPRYASISSPALALMVAGALAAIGCRVWQAALTVLVLICLAYQSWLGYRLSNSKGDLLRVAELVEARSTKGDAVWFAARPPGSDRTPRTVRYAYPDVFAGMPDLTLDRSYEDSGGLWETDQQLTEVAELGTVDRLVGVLFQPEGFPSDFAFGAFEFLKRNGLAEVSRDTAGRWTVVVLQRR